MDSDSSKLERYDRQIRLWGLHGQNKCSSSKICLINADSLGMEILKGLCLAGIGSYTILDSHKLTMDDVGCSFLPHSCIGKNRGESVKQMMSSMNDQVLGQVFPIETHLPQTSVEPSDDSMHRSLEFGNEFWGQFKCVIASGLLCIGQIERLSKICWGLNLPLIMCKSIGFYGYMSIQAKESLIIERHADNPLPIFGLDKLPGELEEYIMSIDLDNDDKSGDYPYIVIVYQYLRKWQQINNHSHHRVPCNQGEKTQLKQLIENGLSILHQKRENKPEVTNRLIPFENFFEAMKALNTCFSVSSETPDSVKLLFDHVSCQESPRYNQTFWLIIGAIKRFAQDHGRLPFHGSLPDMASSSEEYITLQNLYYKKARDDVDSVVRYVDVSESGCTKLQDVSSGIYNEAKLVCHNIRDIKVMTTKPIYEEYDLKNVQLKDEDGEMEIQDYLSIMLCLRALDLFLSTYGRLPGCHDDQVETDISKLKECLRQFVCKKTISRLKSLDQYLYEICRYGGLELHATSAFIGGCIAQEVIKLVTNQYLPVDNTLVYNAMTSLIKTFKFSDAFAKV